jgi:hypothetical protein
VLGDIYAMAKHTKAGKLTDGGNIGGFGGQILPWDIRGQTP